MLPPVTLTNARSHQRRARTGPVTRLSSEVAVTDAGRGGISRGIEGMRADALQCSDNE